MKKSLTIKDMITKRKKGGKVASNELLKESKGGCGGEGNAVDQKGRGMVKHAIENVGRMEESR